MSSINLKQRKLSKYEISTKISFVNTVKNTISVSLSRYTKLIGWI